ncbi:divalent-cation tolerance protein CutA [Vibrio ostreicida]
MSCYQSLETVIVSIHDDDGPQVVHVPFSEAFNPYLAWLEGNARH